jgi:anaerobic ribonucleoside-triphosphate reductase activating protein
MVPLTTLDYPGLLACVLFCQGCAWRCRYCHNPDLIPARGEQEIAWSQVLAFLLRRQGLLQAVVFSGGEATLQGGLVPAMEQVRQLGFRVGLHSAGIKPWTFAWAVKAADWVGFDIKALAEDAELITGVSGSGKANWRSLEHLLASGVDYECRTTVHWHLLDVEKLWRIGQRLHAFGVERFAVQLVRSARMLDAELPMTATPNEAGELWLRLEQLFPHFELRDH